MQPQPCTQRPRSPPPFPQSSPPPLHEREQGDPSFDLGNLSLIDRARALCAAADGVQRATIEASRRIAAIHNRSSKRPGIRENEKPKKPPKEPPDICARPPSDVPPPRGEGWRRVGPVTAVRGSNRLSAPPQTRRALTRNVEVFVGGKKYCIVPADIEPGGGFCVTLDRDFEGETNMACMLYLRKRGQAVRRGIPRDQGIVVQSTEPMRDEKPSSPMLLTKVASIFSRAPPPCEPTSAPAPFGSVGGEISTVAKPTEMRVPPTTIPSRCYRSSPPTPFPFRMERDIVTFTSQPEERGDSNAAIVQEAQRRARRRALTQCKRASAEEAQNLKDCEGAKKSTPADVERLKASRRAAITRVAYRKQQEKAQKHEVERAAMEEAKRREAELASKADAIRAVAAVRAANAVAENMRKERQLENTREEEARAKREKVAAVLARKDSEVLERERQVRNETIRRIRREEKRRELERQREEDEQIERRRLYEAGERAAAAAPAGLGGLARPPMSLPQPVVQSARSFFSVGTRPSSRQSIGLDNTGIIDDGYNDADPTIVILNEISSEEAPDGSDEDRTRGRLHHQNPSGQKVAAHHPSRRNFSPDTDNAEDNGLLEGTTEQWATTTSTPVIIPKSTDGGNSRVGADGSAARKRAVDAAEENKYLRRHNRQRGVYSQICRQDQQRPKPQQRSNDGGGGNQHNTRSPHGAGRGASTIDGGSCHCIGDQEPPSTDTTRYGQNSNNRCASESGRVERRHGDREKEIGASKVLSPEPSTGVLRGPEACLGAPTVSSASSSGSAGSSVQGRRRVKTTPVWKRPVVPLSKPYVPVPRKNGCCFIVR